MKIKQDWTTAKELKSESKKKKKKSKKKKHRKKVSEVTEIEKCISAFYLAWLGQGKTQC